MIVVFSGPTIAHDEVSSIIDCRCLPPVQHGDILKLNLDEISAIGVIDGYFEGAPSVWHKEILYAMDQGVHVYGASSMGALRAAELHVFGMQGVGKIFEWYRDLVIEDDDEVAVLHGPTEAGYAVASESMVNIRRTLELAVANDVITQEDHDALVTDAKKTFYKRRSWRALLEDARWSSLACWVNEHGVDLKKEDAISLLDRMVKDQHMFDQPFKSNFSFEWTNVWDAAFRSIRGQDTPGQLSAADRRVLDQLKLQPDDYHIYASRALSSWVTRHPDRIESGGKVQEALRNFREDKGLMTRAALLAYMEEREITEEALEKQMVEEGRLLQAREQVENLSALIIQQLKESDFYRELADLAEEKERVLLEARISIESARVKRGSYLVWYFEQALGVAVPFDVGRYAALNGFRDGEEFDRIVVGEYLYQRCLIER